MSNMTINQTAAVQLYAAGKATLEASPNPGVGGVEVPGLAAAEAQADIVKKYAVELKNSAANASQAWTAAVHAHGAESDVDDLMLTMNRVQKAIVMVGQSTQALDERVGQLSSLPSETSNAPLGDDWSSYDEFLKMLAEKLGFHDANTLAKYQDALKVFLEFYKAFTDIMEKLKPEASGDKGDVKINFKDVFNELKGLLAEYFPSTGTPLATFSTKEEAEAFAKSLGLPGLAVNQRKDGTYGVEMDMKPVQDLMGSMEGGNEVTWDSAKYNAWVSSRDSNMEQIKHVSKVLGEKLSEMTQKFDNFAKVLSASIDKLFEALKSFINGF